MFKISSTDKNGAPNDFSQILVDPILLIYHIIAKIKRKLSLRSRKLCKKWSLFWFYRRNQEKLYPELRKLCKKGKSILISSQKSRKLLQEHIPFPSQELGKLCKKRSLFWFHCRYQEKPTAESRKLFKSLFWFHRRNQEKPFPEHIPSSYQESR